MEYRSFFLALITFTLIIVFLFIGSSGGMFVSVNDKNTTASANQAIVLNSFSTTSSNVTANTASSPCTALITAISLSKSSLKKGDKGIVVFALQIFLKQKKATSSIFSSNKSGNDAFGIFGDNTSSLLAKFQTLHKLKATGNLDDQTRTELIRAIYNGPNSCKQLTL